MKAGRNAQLIGVIFKQLITFAIKKRVIVFRATEGGLNSFQTYRTEIGRGVGRDPLRVPLAPPRWSSADLHTRVKNMEVRTRRKDFQRVADRLVKTRKSLEYIRDSSVSFVVLGSDSEKKSMGRTVFGQCEKIPDKYRWIIPYDFTITVFEPNVERFTKKQIRILLLHELMHIGIEKDGNEERYFIKPHDIEDFEEILKRYGMDWADDETGKVKKSRKKSRRPDGKSKQ